LSTQNTNTPSTTNDIIPPSTTNDNTLNEINIMTENMILNITKDTENISPSTDIIDIEKKYRYLNNNNDRKYISHIRASTYNY